jgi:pimeloyl-ACP methyl ester carboxylesterase
MRTLYPEIEPYKTGTLQVSPVHTMYYEECGNPKGKPAVFVHGGPGGGFSPADRRFFDPAAWKIVLFDQRGSGKSTLQAAAKAWSIWEGTTSKLFPDPDFIAAYGSDEFALALARIECHYFVNGSWFRSENQLLEDVGRIRHIPATIVQGRYDLVCPIRSAWDLHRAWPEAELVIVPDAGHNSREPGTAAGLVEATDKYR